MVHVAISQSMSKQMQLCDALCSRNWSFWGVTGHYLLHLSEWEVLLGDSHPSKNRMNDPD